ncbi:MAG: hypothetical protein VKN33_04540 [Candidatus Sericytochromatia bacterium]|nr:hypothetical protein [Candidatus Sericytochromatia bacterium]
MWGWVLAWVGARELGRLGRELERAEKEQKEAVREQKRAIALILKDRPATEWASWGLSKRNMLRDLGIASNESPAERGVEFYSSIGRKGDHQ